MMTIGIGVDLVSISRIEKSVKNIPGFAKRICGARELDEIELITNELPKNRSIAKRFAAKEAYYKAYSMALGSRPVFVLKEVEILHFDYGAPYISHINAVESLGRHFTLLSISDDCDIAIAYVTIQKYLDECKLPQNLI